MSEYVQKDWGRSLPLHRGDTFEAYQCEILPGYCCSIHLHREKVNQFVVVSGELTIVTYDRGRYAVTLRAGETLVAPSCCFHRMESKAGAEFYEMYWPAAMGLLTRVSDIERVPGFDGGLIREHPDAAFRPGRDED